MLFPKPKITPAEFAQAEKYLDRADPLVIDGIAYATSRIQPVSNKVAALSPWTVPITFFVVFCAGFMAWQARLAGHKGDLGTVVLMGWVFTAAVVVSFLAMLAYALTVSLQSSPRPVSRRPNPGWFAVRAQSSWGSNGLRTVGFLQINAGVLTFKGDAFDFCLAAADVRGARYQDESVVVSLTRTSNVASHRVTITSMDDNASTRALLAMIKDKVVGASTAQKPAVLRPPIKFPLLDFRHDLIWRVGCAGGVFGFLIALTMGLTSGKMQLDAILAMPLMMAVFAAFATCVDPLASKSARKALLRAIVRSKRENLKVSSPMYVRGSASR